MKSARTEDMKRIYVCKICGQVISEGIYKWRKKPQKYKRICYDCMPKKSVPRSMSPYDTYFP